jgi:hypothetical protein
MGVAALYNRYAIFLLGTYRNFRGVVIFVIFVVDLAVMKISTHENGGAAPCSEAVLESNNPTVFQLMTSSTLIILFVYLMLFVQVSLQNWLSDRGNQADQERGSITSSFALHCAPMDWGALTKFKTMKINSEGFL